MKRKKIRCAHCRRQVLRDPRIKNQVYCGREECQRARKNKWQQRKLLCDADYQANKKRSQDAWTEANQEYWQHYHQKK